MPKRKAASITQPTQASVPLVMGLIFGKRLIFICVINIETVVELKQQVANLTVTVEELLENQAHLLRLLEAIRYHACISGV